MEDINRLEKKLNHLFVLFILCFIMSVICFALLFGRGCDQDTAADLTTETFTEQGTNSQAYLSEQADLEKGLDESIALYRDSRLLENTTEATVIPEEIMIGDDLEYELHNPETEGSRLLAIAFYFTSYESERYVEEMSDDLFMRLLHVPSDYKPEMLEDKYYKSIREGLEKQLGISIEKKKYYFYKVANEGEVDPYYIAPDEADLFKGRDTKDKVVTHSEIWYIAYLTKDEVLRIVDTKVFLDGCGFRMDLAPDFMSWGTELIDESLIYDD